MKRLFYRRGGTNMAAGLKLLREAMAIQKRSAATKIGILITDGRSKNLSATLRESSMARADGITLLSRCWTLH